MYKLRRAATIIVAIIIIILGSQPPVVDAAAEGTYVGGQIRRDTVWTKGKGPYILYDDFTIQQGVRLSIERGVTVDLTLWSITVEGELRAIGTPDEKICFNITLATLKENRNGRIYFAPGSRAYKENGQGCLLEYVVINCSDYAISYGVIKTRQELMLDHVEIHGGLSHWKESAVKMNGTVTNCLFDGTYRTLKMSEGTVTNNVFLNTRYGLAIDIGDGVVRGNILDSGVRGIGVKNALVKGNVVMNMEVVGVSAYSGSTPYSEGESRPIIINNVVMNTGKAIAISGGTRPVINNNVFLENTYGVYFDEGAFYGGAKPRIEYNAFYGNDYNVYMYREDPRITVGLPYNWWGTDNPETIEDKIHDVNDNPRLCRVEYTPILSEPPLYLPQVPYRFTVSSPTPTARLGEQVEITGEIVPPLEEIDVQLLCKSPTGESFETILSTTLGGTFSYTFTPGSVGVWRVTVVPECNVLTEVSVTDIQINVVKITSWIKIDVEPKSILEGDSVAISGALIPAIANEIVEISTVYPGGSELDGHATTGVGGLFAYETVGAQPGVYKVTFTWPGTSEYLGSSETLSYRVQAPSELSIVVEDGEGNVVDGAKVTSSSQPNGQDAVTGVTDSEGRLLLARIAAGDYTFTVEKLGYEPKTFSTRVTEGGKQDVKTVLSEAGTTPIVYPSSTGEEESSPEDDPLILGFVPSILTMGILVALYIAVKRGSPSKTVLE